MKYIKNCYYNNSNKFEIEKPKGEPLQTLWMRGGFPNSYAALNDQASHDWRQNFIRTYLERDIPQLGSAQKVSNSPGTREQVYKIFDSITVTIWSNCYFHRVKPSKISQILPGKIADDSEFGS